MCVSQRTAIHSLHNINRLIFAMDM